MEIFKSYCVLWANALLCGKRDKIGTPNINDTIMQYSLDYLIKIYNFFRPEMILIVSGPNYPYYEIVTQFLKKLNSELYGLRPTRSEVCLEDVDNDIYYTYHPNYLNRIGKSVELSNVLSKKFKK